MIETVVRLLWGTWRRGLRLASLASMPILLLPGPVSAQTWASIDDVSLVSQDTVEIDASASWQAWTYDSPCVAVEFGYGCQAMEVDASVWGSDGYSDYAYDYWADTGYDSWTFWDNSSAPAMEGASYDLEVDVWYYDWAGEGWFEESSYAQGSLAPSGLEITSDHGDTVWWFNGENPDSNNYPTAITLTSSGGSQTQWTLYADGEFGQAVELSATSGESIVVTANDVGSSWEHDTRIVASVGQQTAMFYLTARLPKSLQFLTRADTCPLQGFDYGWLTEYRYDILDQTGTSLPNNVPTHEEWLSDRSFDVEPHDNWDRPPANNGGAGNVTGYIHDQIQFAGQGTDGNVPTATCGSGKDTGVDHWDQGWFVGSLGPTGGVRVQLDMLRRYRGYARHVVGNQVVGG